MKLRTFVDRHWRPRIGLGILTAAVLNDDFNSEGKEHGITRISSMKGVVVAQRDSSHWVVDHGDSLRGEYSVEELYPIDPWVDSIDFLADCGQWLFVSIVCGALAIGFYSALDYFISTNFPGYCDKNAEALFVAVLFCVFYVEIKAFSNLR